MAEKKENKGPKELSNVNSFLIIILFSIFTIIGAYSWTTCDYKDRQQKIVDSQNSQLSKLDSILGSFYSQSMQLSKDTTYYKVILDSINKSKNKKQSYSDSIVKSVISASIKAQAKRELMDLLRKDSIFVHTHIGQIQNDTKAQLTLEFNKLQNEYQELQLWGGILTIVFLIFTFYSLFKTDDLLKQGREGVNELNFMKIKGSEVIEKTSEKLNVLNEQINTTSKTQKNQITDANKNIDELTTRIETITQAVSDSFKEDLEIKISEQKEKLERLYSTYKSKFEALNVDDQPPVTNLPVDLSLTEEEKE